MNHSRPNSAGFPAIWKSIKPRIVRAKQIYLFLDFDGTLSPYTPRAEDARLARGVRPILQALSTRTNIRILIISGRRRADIRRRINLRRLRYMGLHGWEGGARQPRSGEIYRRAQTIRHTLNSRISELPGLELENKGFGIVLHRRRVSQRDFSRYKAAITRVLFPFKYTFRIIENRRDWEILPLEVRGKGSAVRAILASSNGDGVLPIYIGDDTSDESAFAALSRGLTLLVGPSRPTKAKYRLRGTREVRQFLARLEKELR